MEGGIEDYDKGWPMNAREFGPPCVGLCHYFRENNITNPGYRFQHTGIEIDFVDEPLGEPKPSSLPQNMSTCFCENKPKNALRPKSTRSIINYYK